MSSRKPLVMNAGQIQQLQAGDSLDAVVSEVELISLTADQTLIVGNVVYATTADHCDKAIGSAAATTRAIGISKLAGTSVQVQTSGVVALTTAQWDAAFGSSSGLAVGSVYYLSPSSAGLGTATAPTTVSQFVVEIGVALSTTELLLAIKRPILL